MNLVKSQLIFLQSFVEDLLDLGQLKDGNFVLANSIFDPNETLKVVIDAFRPMF